MSTSVSKPDIELPFLTQQLNTGNAFEFCRCSVFTCRADDSSQTRRDAYTLLFTETGSSGMHGFQYLSGNKKASTYRGIKNERGSREDDGSEKQR